MFNAHPPGRPSVVVSAEADVEGSAWLALLDPTDGERALAERLTGLRMPTRQDVEEIESSSRVFVEDGTFYLSTPLVRRTEELVFSAPVGFVVGHDRLITVRYSDYPVFDLVAKRLARQDAPHDAEDSMLMLLEAIVDRLADLLEMSGRQLDALSRQIFQMPVPHGQNLDRSLRALLQRVGRETDLVSGMRDSLLGMQRIALFISENGDRPCQERLRTRLSLLSKDINSLNDYDGQLNNKVQFLLDATLGFINIEQNNGIKILTVVSIVGIPPTLIASIYGMNFKDIPELSWSYGYWYALALMAATIVLPMIWFWRKGGRRGR